MNITIARYAIVKTPDTGASRANRSLFPKCKRGVKALPRRGGAAIGAGIVSSPTEKAAGMKLRIVVTLKPGVLDPQGKAIEHALTNLGFGGVESVRAGKIFELEVADGTDDAAIDSMCRKLLANTVIENYRVERAA